MHPEVSRLMLLRYTILELTMLSKLTLEVPIGPLYHFPLYKMGIIRYRFTKKKKCIIKKATSALSRVQKAKYVTFFFNFA